MSPAARLAAAPAVILALATLLVPAAATAQSIGGAASGAPDSRGYASGQQDGRQQGRLDGAAMGRDQVLVRALVEAFSSALDAVRSEGDAEWSQRARTAASADASVTGRPAGERAGRQEALDHQPVSVPTPPEAPPLPDALEACRPPLPLTIELPSQRLVTLDLALMPKEGVSLTFEIPEPDLPSVDRLRNRGRMEEHLQGMDLDLYTDGYRRGYRDAYRETYHEERMNVSEQKKDELAQTGRVAGELEGRRRAACRVLADAWAQAWGPAWQSAWMQGHDAALAETSAQMASGGVVALEDATLADADGDGVLAPGDEVVLRGRLVALGQGAAGASAGRWTALRGFAVDEPPAADAEPAVEGTPEAGAPAPEAATPAPAGGDLGPAPPSGGDRTIEIPVGRVAAGAPLRASLVVMIEPAGGGREPVVGKVGRPVVFDGVDASLEVADGHLVARIAATVECVATRGATSGLRLAAGDASTPLPPVATGASETMTVQAPVLSPAALGSPTPAVRVQLLDADGATWDEAEASLTVPVERLVALASSLADPGPLLDALATRLTRSLAVEVEDAAAVEAGRGEVAAYARARGTASPALRPALDQHVTDVLLKALDDLGAERRARKAVRDALGT